MFIYIFELPFFLAKSRKLKKKSEHELTLLQRGEVSMNLAYIYIAVQSPPTAKSLEVRGQNDERQNGES